MTWVRTIAVAALLMALASVTAAQVARPLRILFIGNSLTAWNDLPDMVMRLAMAGGHPQPLTRTVVVGGFSLEEVGAEPPSP